MPLINLDCDVNILRVCIVLFLSLWFSSFQNDNNKAETTCVQRSWLRIFYEELFSIYTNVKEAFCEALGVTAVGALAVAVKKAIKF